MELLIEDIKIRVWVISNPSGAERGIATIIIGPIYIKGFRILENDELHRGATQFWVAPPAYRTRKGKFVAIFWLSDKDLWQKIQAKILEEFNNLLEKKPDLKTGFDDIPIIEENKHGYYKPKY